MEFIKPKFDKRNEFPLGVYKIMFNDKWFYIGSTSNLKKRFVRWKTSVNKPYFFNSRKIKEILPLVTVVKIEILKICDDYKKEETEILKLNWNNPFLLNERKPIPILNKLGKFDLNNNLIKVYDNIYDAAKSINCIVADITNDLIGKRYSVKGFRFKIMDENGDFIEHESKEIHPCSRKLSHIQVKEIRKLRKKGALIRELACKYGVSNSVIFNANQANH